MTTETLKEEQQRDQVFAIVKALSRKHLLTTFSCIGEAVYPEPEKRAGAPRKVAAIVKKKELSKVEGAHVLLKAWLRSKGRGAYIKEDIPMSTHDDDLRSRFQIFSDCGIGRREDDSYFIEEARIIRNSEDLLELISDEE